MPLNRGDCILAIRESQIHWVKLNIHYALEREEKNSQTYSKVSQLTILLQLEYPLSNIWKFISYFQENTLHLYYNNKAVNNLEEIFVFL